MRLRNILAVVAGAAIVIQGGRLIKRARRRKQQALASSVRHMMQGLSRVFKVIDGRVAAVDHRRLRFIDETGVNLAMTRLYGRAPRGKRVRESVPRNYGTQTSLIGAISVSGVEAVMTVEGAVDAEVFDAYVEHVLRRV